jgi:uncharacterized protein YkwD
MLFAFGASQPATADVLTEINGARRQCQPGLNKPLKFNKLLAVAAKSTSQGLRPKDAAQAAGYAMTQAALIHLEGFDGELQLQSLLARKFCAIVGDNEARDVGYYQRHDAIWIVIGAARGDPGNPVAVANRALLLVNQARLQSRQCGGETFDATAPLVLNPLLTQAAQKHSNEMARLRYMDHTGKDGSTPATRIASTGYQWQLVGENIAAGEDSVDLAVEDWLTSPHHCANIMDPTFKEMGIAFAINKSDAEYGVYWTQTFGTPKSRKK